MGTDVSHCVSDAAKAAMTGKLKHDTNIRKLTIMKVKEDPKNWMFTNGAQHVSTAPPASQGHAGQTVATARCYACDVWTEPADAASQQRLTNEQHP